MNEVELKHKSNYFKLIDELSKYKVKCECGHVMIMIDKKKDTCNWCGRLVYRSKKDEFEDKLKKVVKKG